MVTTSFAQTMYVLASIMIFMLLYGILYMSLFKQHGSRLIASFGFLILSLGLFFVFDDVFFEVIPIIAVFASVINLILQFINVKFPSTNGGYFN